MSTRFGANRTSDAATQAEAQRRPFMQDRGSQEETESRLRRLMRVIEALSVRVKGGGSVIVDDGGSIALNDGGKLEVFDDNGVRRVVVGNDAGDYDVKVFDNTGANEVKLSTLAFGQTAAVDNDLVTTTMSVGWVELGPEVSVTVGPSGRALVLFGANIGLDIDESGRVAVGVSGASTVAASDDTGIYADIFQTGGESVGVAAAGSRALIFDSLNEGVNTFTLFYNASATFTYTVEDRWIIVFPF